MKFMSQHPGLRPVLEPLERRTHFSVSHFDLSPGALNPSNMTVFGKRVVFAGETDSAGREFWITDGTAADTRVIADLFPGPTGSDPKPLAPAGRYLYFWADTSAAPKTQTGLWRTDGLGRNTVFLSPGDKEQYLETKALGSTLVFLRGRDGSKNSHADLWVSDGTPTGTKLVAGAGSGSVIGGHITDLAVASDGSAAYVVNQTTDPVAGQVSQLWKLDSVMQNPQLLMQGQTVGQVMPDGRTVYAGAQIAGRRGLWRVSPGAKPTLVGGFHDLQIPDLQPMTGGMWFFAKERAATDSIQMWRLDGAGLRQMTRFDGEGIPLTSAVGFTPAGATFTMPGGQLWGALNDDPGAIHSFTFPDRAPTRRGDVVTGSASVAGGAFITVYDGRDTWLWRVREGEAEPSRLTKVQFDTMIRPTPTGVIFGKRDMFDLTQLWVMDPAKDDGVQLTRVMGGRAHATTRGLTPFKGGVLFTTTASTGAPSFGLWLTDAAGKPQPLLHAVGESSSNGAVITAGSVAYFSFGSGDQSGLWRTDGTAAGTFRVGTNKFSNVKFLAADDQGRVYFNESNAFEQRDLFWVSDGTAAGTRLLRLFTRADHQGMGMFDGRSIVWRGNLYASFIGRLWRSDGATFVDETAALAGTRAGADNVYNLSFAVRDGKLLIGGARGTATTIWERSSPSATSVPAVVDVPGRGTLLSMRVADNGRDLWALVHRVLVSPSGNTRSAQLYRIDAAARAVKGSFDVGGHGAYGEIVGELGGRAILHLADGADLHWGVNALYLSDGTEANTRWLRNAKRVNTVTVMGGSIYFTTTDRSTYRENSLYRINGTSAAATITAVATTPPNAPGVTPASVPFVAVGFRLFWGAGGSLGSYQFDRSVEGFAYNDTNGNGVRDAGEARLAGWRVFIDRDRDGIWDANELFTFTRASGHYAFDDLGSGRIQLRISTGAKFAGTTPITYSVVVAPGTSPRRHFGIRPIT